jgi:hypothetical protein
VYLNLPDVDSICTFGAFYNDGDHIGARGVLVPFGPRTGGRLQVYLHSDSREPPVSAMTLRAGGNAVPQPLAAAAALFHRPNLVVKHPLIPHAMERVREEFATRLQLS